MSKKTVGKESTDLGGNDLGSVSSERKTSRNLKLGLWRQRFTSTVKGAFSALYVVFLFRDKWEKCSVFFQNVIGSVIFLSTLASYFVSFWKYYLLCTLKVSLSWSFERMVETPCASRPSRKPSRRSHQVFHQCVYSLCVSLDLITCQLWIPKWEMRLTRDDEQKVITNWVDFNGGWKKKDVP